VFCVINNVAQSCLVSVFPAEIRKACHVAWRVGDLWTYGVRIPPVSVTHVAHAHISYAMYDSDVTIVDFRTREMVVCNPRTSSNPFHKRNLWSRIDLQELRAEEASTFSTLPDFITSAPSVSEFRQHRRLIHRVSWRHSDHNTISTLCGNTAYCRVKWWRSVALFG